VIDSFPACEQVTKLNEFDSENAKVNDALDALLLGLDKDKKECYKIPCTPDTELI
jgi:hypothetical protein